MFHKRKKLTKEQIDEILNNKVAIWHWGIAEGMDKPIQLVFPGQAVLHDYPGRKSYFTVPNSPDKFYLKEYDYFWWTCPNRPPELDEALDDPEAIPGRG